MDVYEAIEKRSSVRAFEKRDVPPQTVEKILAAAVKAPSAGNVQPWLFLVVRDVATKEALAISAAGQRFLADAPLLIVVCADLDRAAARYGTRGSQLYCLQDTAAAIENLLLAITAEGLGACWVGAFSEQAAAEILKLPNRLRPVAMLPVGYPAQAGRKTSRRSLSEVTDWR